MDPRQLRDLVEAEINTLIDHDLWEQQEALQAREKQSLELHLRSWALYQSLSNSSAAWGLL
jgi:hypothetical protein